MKIAQTDYCRFCYNVPETHVHVLGMPLCPEIMENNLGACFYIHSRKY